MITNIKKEKVPNIYKNNWKKSQSIRNEDSKDHQNIINNSNGSISIIERGYEINGKAPKSISKNKKYNNKSENKKIILPNVYGINKSGIYNNSPSKNINNRNNVSYKIMNSDNNIIINNGVKVIDGKNKNIIGNNQKSSSIDLKKKKFLINQLNNEIEKMILQSNNIRPINLNKYNKDMEEKEFLKLLNKRKKRMFYIGKI